MSTSQRAKKWIIRFIKFNIVGFIVFLVGTAIFASTFSTFEAWTWLVASTAGGILQNFLIVILNRTKIGKMFDSCEQRALNIQTKEETI